MKHFLVSDDVGTPIYFDHPDGRMLTLPIATTQDVMTANFADSFSSMVCGETIFVFHRFDQLCFTVISDQGESESFLRAQLRLLHDMLMLVFGPKILHAKKQINFLKHQKFLQKLFDTMCWMSEKYQSFLIEAVEYVEVNDKLRSFWVDTLKKLSEQSTKIVHANIFVGSKLLASFSKPKAPELSISDIHLLIIYFMGQFHPHVHELTETVIPVADYTDHAKVIQSFQLEEETVEQNLVEDGSISANEEWDIDDYKSEEEQLLFMNPEFTGLFDEILKEMEFEEEHENHKALLHNLILFMLSNIGDGTVNGFVGKVAILRDILQQGFNPEKSSHVQILQVFLIGIGLSETGVSDGIYSASFVDSMKRFQDSLNKPATGEGDKDTIKQLLITVARLQPPEMSSSYKKSIHTVNNNSTTGSPRGSMSFTASGEMEKTPMYKSKDEWVDSPSSFEPDRNFSSSPSPPHSPAPESYTDSPLTPHIPIITSLNKDSPVVLSLSTTSMLGLTLSEDMPVPISEQQPEVPPPADPIYTSIYLRAPNYAPYWVYTAEIENSVTLVIINKNSNGSPEEKEYLNTLLSSLRHAMKNYIDFLITKERTHISALSYVHQLPGLVHFIYIDRTTNKVIAPIIGPLHGQQYEKNDESTKSMVNLVTKKVWDMCYQAHKHLSLGYCSMLMKSGDFQYSYRLWLEDNDHTEVPFDQDIVTPTSNPASGHSFYKDLIKRTARATKCYELYCLSLGILSVNIIASHEKKLLIMMNPNRKFPER